MATKKRLDQLPAILSGDVGNNDLMYLVNENALAETGYDSKKILVAEVAKKLLGGVELPTALPDFPEGEQNALSALEYLNEKINDLYPVVTESGSLATFTTPLALPLVSLKANITAQQAGTGTPSPQNIRSISGFDSVHINYVDFNQLIINGNFDGSTNWSKNGSATTFSVSNNTAILTATTNNGGIYSSNIALVENHKYFYSFFVKNSNTLNCGFSQFTEGRKTISASTTSKRYTYIGTPTSSGNGQFAFYNSGNVENNFEIKNVNFIDLTQMFGSTIADYLYSLPDNGLSIVNELFYKDYYAYSVGGSLVTVASVNGDNYPDSCVISLGDTYYGGVLDCKTGTATITHIKETFKWSEGGAVADLGTYTRKMFVSSTMANESLVQLCNVAPYAYNYSSDSLHFYCRAYTNDTRIYLFLDEDNLPTGFDEFEVIYGLATPITLTGLTPDNFTTIAGENNIFADSGDVELSFKQGIQEYIDEQIATTQALIL